MLLGTTNHGIDAKGRIIIPAKWRDDLGEVIVITLGLINNGDARCLFAMSVDQWMQFSAKFTSLSETNTAGQNIRRLLFMNASDCEMDKQGRILIPQKLRDYAGIKNETSLVGMQTRVEIWDSETLDRISGSIQDNYNEFWATLAEQGI
ncbi:division/cell wall cluster transcriptional repressor MraZ [Eubacteriales bacterium OttesenSCG-928-K08]|nr:division/cell wall cluster transcriptional repressor MraZ [Eubacteriales bacterium OttesenSCG-928-K08]